MDRRNDSEINCLTAVPASTNQIKDQSISIIKRKSTAEYARVNMKKSGMKTAAMVKMSSLYVLLAEQW